MKNILLPHVPLPTAQPVAGSFSGGVSPIMSPPPQPSWNVWYNPIQWPKDYTLVEKIFELYSMTKNLQRSHSSNVNKREKTNKSIIRCVHQSLPLGVCVSSGRASAILETCWLDKLQPSNSRMRNEVFFESAFTNALMASGLNVDSRKCRCSNA